ncbi:hypothetical protein SAMN04487894_10778 [Niabella drilacis]|uniref:Uncharacterized protein n=2 Tax=Niabella drilacis (strain DSM 25811 / CCM 8410 / CCUG 62505 / LMG 26954 / E90) TaxID=1285928 RepID=A0A1G6T3H4_NIADE|nr:hypothetical protein SAMN04487894_10778 [Niabella drilacis]
MLALCFTACKNSRQHRETERAFYYWKSIFAPTSYEKRRADSLGVTTLYLKLFDVVWNKTSKAPEPAARLLVKDTAWLLQKKIIPAVFITNECFYEQDSMQIVQLAKNITSLAGKLAEQNGFGSYPELQVDCDWSGATRDRYFQFLRTVRELNRGKRIAATIRLHQVKYRQSSGVPPVDRGLLMCYNMGDLQQAAVKNSIIDAQEFRRYIQRVATYPLPLDAGLPLFSWVVVFDKGAYAGLIRNADISPGGAPALERSGTGYRVLKDTLLGGRLIKTGQFLRPERSDAATVNAVGRLLSGKLGGRKLSVALYHLDSLTLNKYSLYELESIYNSLR